MQFGDAPPLSSLPGITPDRTTRAGLNADAILGAGAPLGTGDTAVRFAEAVASADPSPVDTLLLYYANPLASSAQPEAWRRALERIPYVVSFSPFLDDTTAQADLVIPDLLPYERWQDAPSPSSYPHPVWALARPMVEAPPTTRQTGDVLLTLSSMLGDSVSAALPHDNFESLLQARADGSSLEPADDRKRLARSVSGSSGERGESGRAGDVFA